MSDAHIPSAQAQSSGGESESLRLLLDSCGMGVAVILCDGELAYSNGKFLAMVGYPPDEIPERLERFLNGERAAVITEVNAAGAVVPAEMRKVFSQWMGQKAVFVYLTESAVSPAIYEKALTERKEEVVELMAGGIAHDLNNFSAIILGNLSLARGDVKPDTDLAALLKDVELGAKRAKDFANYLMMLSKAPIQYKKAVTIESVFSVAVKLAFENGADFLEVSYAEAGMTIQADETLLTKAIANVLIVCRQATGGAGAIQVRVARASIGTCVTGGRTEVVELLVQHQGTGFPPVSARRLFEPYFIPKQKEFPRGGKLDLAFTAAVVKKHGGTIKVDSVQGGQTTFVIQFPL